MGKRKSAQFIAAKVFYRFPEDARAISCLKPPSTFERLVDIADEYDFLMKRAGKTVKKEEYEELEISADELEEVDVKQVDSSRRKQFVKRDNRGENQPRTSSTPNVLRIGNLPTNKAAKDTTSAATASASTSSTSGMRSTTFVN